LPFDVQLKLVHSIRGLERAHIVRPGYAIEYDYFDPRNLQASLETKSLGASSSRSDQWHHGYEEAAAQGLLRASTLRFGLQGREPWWRDATRRTGVLGGRSCHARRFGAVSHVHERAEYRLMLREDNADLG